MKISKLEAVLLCVTAAFLLLTAGYFLGSRSAAEPYRVEVQLREEEPLAAPTTSVPQGKVNLNTATAAELEALPGIGAKRAEDIVADRTANGPFRIVEDITRVKGIGEGTLEGLIEYITVE